MPPPVITTAQLHGNFAGVHIYQPALVSNLKVPASFNVSVTASCVGTAGMLHSNASGLMYVSRRDQGDVFLPMAC